jgi:hypothetical protein
MDLRYIDVGITSDLYFSKGGTIEKVKDLYEGAIFPTRSFLDDVLTEGDPEYIHPSTYIHDFKQKVTFPIETLFEKGGPGVYYWGICRSVGRTSKDLESYSSKFYEAIGNSWLNDPRSVYLLSRENRYTPYLHENLVISYPKVEPLMDENMADPKLNPKLKGQLYRTRMNMEETIKKIRNIRKKSINAQVKAGSRHRTYKRRPQNRRRTRRA